MKIDIFSEINKELKLQKRKSPWLAEEIGTSARNMYGILNTRKDIYVGDLTEISIALKKNFFKLYVPFIEAAISSKPIKEIAPETSINEKEEMSTLRMGIKYPESQAEAIGTFLKQVKLLAKEYGFEVE